MSRLETSAAANDTAIRSVISGHPDIPVRCGDNRS